MILSKILGLLINRMVGRAYMLPWWPSGKECACSGGDEGSLPGLGRSSGERNGNPLQYSCLKNPTDRGAWRPTVHGVAKSWTRLNNKAELIHGRNLVINNYHSRGNVKWIFFFQVFMVIKLTQVKNVIHIEQPSFKIGLGTKQKKNEVHLNTWIEQLYLKDAN